MSDKSWFKLRSSQCRTLYPFYVRQISYSLKIISGIWGVALLFDQTINKKEFQWCERVNTILEHKREYFWQQKKYLTLLPFKQHLILMVMLVRYFYINCGWTINFQISRSRVLFTFLIETVSEDHKAWVKFKRIFHRTKWSEQQNVSQRPMCH